MNDLAIDPGSNLSNNDCSRDSDKKMERRRPKKKKMKTLRREELFSIPDIYCKSGRFCNMSLRRSELRGCGKGLYNFMKAIIPKRDQIWEKEIIPSKYIDNHEQMKYPQNSNIENFVLNDQKHNYYISSNHSLHSAQSPLYDNPYHTTSEIISKDKSPISKAHLASHYKKRKLSNINEYSKNRIVFDDQFTEATPSYEFYSSSSQESYNKKTFSDIELRLNVKSEYDEYNSTCYERYENNNELYLKLGGSSPTEQKPNIDISLSTEGPFKEETMNTLTEEDETLKLSSLLDSTMDILNIYKQSYNANCLYDEFLELCRDFEVKQINYLKYPSYAIWKKNLMWFAAFMINRRCGDFNTEPSIVESVSVDEAVLNLRKLYRK